MEIRTVSKAERSLTLYFFFGIMGGIAPIVLASGYPFSTRIAAAGGTLAAIGGIAIFRSMLRVGGPFNLITLEVFKDMIKSGEIKDTKFERYLERLEDKEEIEIDLELERKIGPMFIAMGTLINGYSGFAG